MAAKAEQKKAMEASLARLEKKFGSGIAVQMGSKKIEPIEVFHSGSIALDLAIGDQGVNCGIPWGRIIELYGSECLDADTFLVYSTVVDGSGRLGNHKGGTIRRLYEKFHGITPQKGTGKGKYPRKQSIGASFYARSVNSLGRVISNKILDVVHRGKKYCYEVKVASGFSIVASDDHEFLTDEGFVCLSNLCVGQEVKIHNNIPFTVESYQDSNRIRKYLYVKNHPVAGMKVVERGRYKYYRLKRSRAVVEAKHNGLTLAQYVDRLNSGNLEGLWFLSRDEHVHHEDDDVTNDSEKNLEVMDPVTHGKVHAAARLHNLSFICVPDKIISIKPVGERDAYDLVMQQPHKNYIANHFVVHNSGGKTTLALTIVAQVQRMGKLAAYIDAEHALDPTYAVKLGVDMKTLVVCQPDYGEQGLEVADELISGGAVSMVVVDSVAGLVPKAELEGEMGDSHVGLQPRMMGQALRKLSGKVRTHDVCMVFINQIREKVGVMFGNPEITPGGRALKFWASLRLDIRKGAVLKDGERAVGIRIKAKVVKNKIAKPFKETEFDLIFGEGISRAGEIVDLGAHYGVLAKEGSWYNYQGERMGQGREQAKKWLKESPELAEAIEREIYKRAALEVM